MPYSYYMHMYSYMYMYMYTCMLPRNSARMQISGQRSSKASMYTCITHAWMLEMTGM